MGMTTTSTTTCTGRGRAGAGVAQPAQLEGYDPSELETAWDDLSIAGQAFERAFQREWASEGMVNERGQPLSFDGRPWLVEIWDDPHPRQAVKKAAQKGLTVWAYTKAFHRAGLFGETVIYTLPTDGDMRDFVSGRLDKVIDASPKLRALVGKENSATVSRHKPPDNTEVKYFGKGVIYLRGAKAASGTFSVPAQVIIRDEVDASNQQVLEAFLSRLKGVDPPSARQIYDLSTPTLPGFGIDAIFESGDARQWLVRCTSCNWWGPLEYWPHTEGHLSYLRCTECGAKLDPRNGEWVAAHSQFSERLHSYHYSGLLDCVPERPDILLDIHQARHDAFYPYLFHNTVLGETSTEGTMQVDLEKIKMVAWQVGHPFALAAGMFGMPYFMGIDQGSTLNFMIGHVDLTSPGQVIVDYLARHRDPTGGSEGWREAHRLMNAFNITMCVVDAKPNMAPAHDLANAFPDRVLCCHYGEDMKTEVQMSGDVRRQAEEQQSVLSSLAREHDMTSRYDITVDRTPHLDRTISDLLTGVFQFPATPDAPECQEMLKQFGNNVRKPEQTKDGGQIFRWVKQGGANDYFHTNGYLRLAVELGLQFAQTRPARVGVPTILGASPRRR